MKQCVGCLRFKSEEKFNRDGEGRKSKCKLCTRDADRSYRYGLDVETYRTILAAQCYCCAVCGDPFNEDRAPNVDHDHNCCPGRVGCGRCNRGLVCGRCNKMLGMVEDDPDILERAMEYLNRELL